VQAGIQVLCWFPDPACAGVTALPDIYGML